MAAKTPPPAKLSTLFRHDPSAADSAPIWQRYLRHRRIADRNALCEMYAPWARVLAFQFLTRVGLAGGNGRRRSKADFDDMTQDACIGLLRAAETWDGVSSTFLYFSRLRIRAAVRYGWDKRRGVGPARGNREYVVACARADLIAEKGRLPLADELAERLRGVFTNPNIHLGDRDTVSLNFADEDGNARSIDPVDTRETPALLRVAGKEAMQLALAGMKPLDRKAFKLLMRGVSETDIAKRMGVSRQRIHQRLNGVLWELRSRADLAACLGVEPEKNPAAQRKDYRAIKNTAPARRAVG